MGQVENLENEAANKRYDDYLAERSILIEGERECSQGFDKYLITLSAGALGLSIAFVEKIAPTPKFLWVMCTSWVAFALALIGMLGAFRYGQSAYRKQRDILDDKYIAQERDEPDIVQHNKFTDLQVKYIQVSWTLFIIAVVLLVLFSVINITARERKNVSPAQNKNSVVTKDAHSIAGVKDQDIPADPAVAQANNGSITIHSKETTIIVPR